MVLLVKLRVILCFCKKFNLIIKEWGNLLIICIKNVKVIFLNDNGNFNFLSIFKWFFILLIKWKFGFCSIVFLKEVLYKNKWLMIEIEVFVFIRVFVFILLIKIDIVFFVMLVVILIFVDLYLVFLFLKFLRCLFIWWIGLNFYWYEWFDLKFVKYW